MTNRSTIQRSLVLEAVKELNCHATADQIYEAVLKKYKGISRGTVYRNLKLLSDINEIRKLEIPGGAVKYEYMIHKHYHAICESCGKVFDMEMEPICGLEKNVKNTSGFTFKDHDIIFRVICPKCNS